MQLVRALQLLILDPIVVQLTYSQMLVTTLTLSQRYRDPLQRGLPRVTRKQRYTEPVDDAGFLFGGAPTGR